MSQGDDGLEDSAGHRINNVLYDTMVMIVRLATKSRNLTTSWFNLWK